MVTTAIRKCQSKKHSGGGCDDPKCPEKMAYNAMMDNSVKTQNFDDFAKAKGKLDEKANAQQIDSLMRKTGFVEPNKVNEIKNQFNTLSQLEASYKELQDNEDLVAQADVYEYAKLDLHDHNELFNRYTKALHSSKKEKEKLLSLMKEEEIKQTIDSSTIGVNQHAIDNLSKNNITNFLNRNENKKLIAEHEKNIVNINDDLIVSKERVSRLQHQIAVEENATESFTKRIDELSNAFKRDKATIDEHGPSVNKRYKNLSNMEQRHNQVRREALSSLNKISIKSVPDSIIRYARSAQGYTPLRKHAFIADYNRQVAQVKLSSATEPVKKKQLFKLKDEFTNSILEARDKEVVAYNKRLRTGTGPKTGFTNLDSVKNDAKKMMEFLGEFGQSPLGTVFDY